MHEKWAARWEFAWQVGYAAFSVSQSNRAAVVRYIANQEEHHRKISFQEELLAYLKRHHIAYDERFIWGLKNSYAPAGADGLVWYSLIPTACAVG